MKTQIKTILIKLQFRSHQLELKMKNVSTKNFKFKVDLNLKIITEITATNANEAKELLESMSIDDLLKHDINDISTIDITNWD